MRSVERFLLAALAALAAGCSTVSEPLKTLQQAVTPAPAATTAAATAPRPEPEAPVASAVRGAYDQALGLLRAGRNDDAERAFKAIAQENPDLGGPHANLALIYRRAGKLPEAATHGEQAVKLNPQQPVYWNQLGITYRHMGRFTQAREAYEKAIALDPSDAAAHLNLGILYDLYLGDGKHALDLYDRYLALSPGGDATVNKWVADLRNRKPPAVAMNRKEKE